MEPTQPRSWLAALLLWTAILALTPLPVMAVPPEEFDAQAIGPLVQAWSAFYRNQATQAIRAVEPLTRSPNLSTRGQALHLKARCLWLSGEPASRKQAIGLWNQIQSQCQGDPLILARLQVAKALMLCEQDQEIQAIDLLQKLVSGGPQSPPSMVIIEASIELALLQAQAGQAKAALEVLAKAETILEHPTGHGIPQDFQKPLTQAIEQTRQALEQPGKALFDQAKGRQREGYYPQAADLFHRLIRQYEKTDSDYVPRGQLEIGFCYVGMERPRQTVEHWRKFIAAAPAGPWRGQAYVGLIDLHLEETLDLAEADKYAQLAQSSLAAATSNLQSSSSWKIAAFDLYLRLGLVNLCRGKNDLAVQALETAFRLASDPTPPGSTPGTPGRSPGNAPGSSGGAGSVIGNSGGVGSSGGNAGGTSGGRGDFQGFRGFREFRGDFRGLHTLIAAAKANQPLLPPDVAPRGSVGFIITPADSSIRTSENTSGITSGASGGGEGSAFVNSGGRAALALYMGMIYHLAGRQDKADAFFDRILGTPAIAAKPGTPAQPARPAMQGATPAQLAFATFGKGAVLQARRLEPQAKEQFLASLKAFPNGSWHDESLYRLAVITRNQAEIKSRQASEPVARPGQPAPTPTLTEKDAAAKAGKDARPLTAQERQEREKAGKEALAKAEKERAAALLKAKSQALPYWREILSRYPRSPRCEPALYNVGVLQYEQAEAGLDENAKPLSAAQAEKAWQNAADTLKQFCEAYPKSEMAGDAYVKSQEIALEKLFNLKLAQALAPQAAQWAKTADEAARIDSSALPVWAMRPRPQDNPQVKQIAYECLLKAGLISYLAGNFDQAVEYIHAAGPKPPKEGYAEKPDLKSIGLYYLLKAIRGKKSLTDQQVLNAAKTDQQRLVLQLGDLYMETIRPDRAGEIFQHILDQDPRLGQIPPALEGYAMLQIATALDRQEDRRAQALEWLGKLAARKDLQGTHWGGCGLFRLALFTYNQTQDPKKSLPLYEAMLKQYPNHEFTELAHLYYCLDAIQLNDNALAEKAGQAFLEKYPNSEYRALLQRRLDAFAKRTK